MFKKLHYKVRGLPTPLAGLALGIASLGWCLENALPLAGWGQTTGAVIGLVMIGFLVLRFTAHHDTLWADLKHPVVGSIVPTFAMCLMVVSKTAGHWMPEAGVVLWCAAVLLHLAALGIFVVNRLQEPRLELMVPSWFVPPIGIVVADVTFPEVAVLLPFAKVLFWMGAAAYAVLLPLMIYRLFFLPEVPNGAKPTIAILAAPASLLLAGYLTVEKDPSLLLVALLFGIAILMTVVIYFAFWRLLRLQFSPGYAAFTFPMAIGATALYKLSNLGTDGHLRHLAHDPHSHLGTTSKLAITAFFALAGASHFAFLDMTDLFERAFIVGTLPSRALRELCLLVLLLALARDVIERRARTRAQEDGAVRREARSSRSSRRASWPSRHLLRHHLRPRTRSPSLHGRADDRGRQDLPPELEGFEVARSRTCTPRTSSPPPARRSRGEGRQ